MSMLRNTMVLSLGAVCATAFGASPAPLATVKNNQPAAAVVGGLPPALVTGKPRFPIIPAGVPIKVTPITRTTNNKGVPQVRQAASGQGAAAPAAQIGSGPVVAGAASKFASKNTGPGKSIPPATPTSPAPVQTPAAPAPTPGNAPAPSAPAVPATPSSGNGGNSGGSSTSAPAAPPAGASSGN